MAKWAPERIARLERLYREGKGTREIIQELGGFEHCYDGGRSAVLGMLHRLRNRGRPIPRILPAERARRCSVGQSERHARWRPPPKPKPARVTLDDPCARVAAALLAQAAEAQRRRDGYRATRP